MLEIWNFARNYTLISSFRKWVFSTRILLILLMSAFFGKNRTFTQRISRSCSSVFSFFKIKGYENKSFTDHASRIRLLDCPKLLEMTSKWQWRHNLLTWRHGRFFDFWSCCDVFLLLSLFNGPSFILISLLALELHPTLNALLNYKEHPSIRVLK